MLKLAVVMVAHESEDIRVAVKVVIMSEDMCDRATVHSAGNMIGILKQHRKEIVFWLIGAALIAGAFYWYSWRPYKIRRWCSTQAYQAYKNGNGSIDRTVFDWGYNACIHGQGLSE